jgi:mRNA interferase MazF
VTRGDVYRVRRPAEDPKRSRAYVVVSRQPLIDSRFSTVICAPIYSQRGGLETEVAVGNAEGLKHASSIHCDALVSVAKVRLTDYVSRLSAHRMQALDQALRVALAVE